MDGPTKILIVDDEDVALTTMALILGAEHQVHKASSAEEALAIFQPGEFAVVVCDLKLGAASGIDVLETMAEADPSCARILLTAFGKREVIIDAVNRGKIFMYLDKPCDPGTLQFAVRRAAERWLLERERRALSERLSVMEQSAAVGRFAASVAHDIRNYLTPLFAAADEKDPADMADALNTAREASEAILALVTEMQALGKGGRPRYRMQVASLEDVVHEAIVWARRLPIAAGRSIKVDFARAPNVRLAKARLRRVFINLLKNALEAVPESGTVEVRGTRMLNDVVVTISDNGQGMLPEVAASCFEPFFSTKGDDGTGLGLYICRTIVAGHSGTISVDSRYEEGTKFTIKIPAMESQSRKTA